MAQSFTLDPTSEDAANVPLELLSSTAKLFEHSYPAPPLEIQYAGSVDTEGSVPGSRKYANRVITLKIWCLTRAALVLLEAKVAKIGREGGTYKWVSSTGETIVFDLLAHDVFEPLFDLVYNARGVAQVSVTFAAKPFGRGAPVTLSDHVETTLPVLVFTETTIAGDVPALGKLTIDNDEAGSEMGYLVWGLRSKNYSSAATAALYYEAESCALGVGVTTGAGSPSGTSGTVAKHSSLGAGEANSKILVYAGTTNYGQTHVGTYRVFARLHAPAANAGVVSARFIWSLDLGANQIQNDVVNVVEQNWRLTDLGQVTISQRTLGVQSWGGFISVWSTVAGDDVECDCVILVPVDEGSGQAADNISPMVASASGQVVIQHNGAFRSLAGGVWPDAPNYEGDFLLVPPSGAEGRTAQFIVKLSHGSTPDGFSYAEDMVDLSARLTVTPRYLVIPG